MVKKLTSKKLSTKKEKSADFFNRKLHVYQKYIQISMLIVDKYVDPVHCTVCKEIVFYGSAIDFTDEKNNEIKLPYVCLDCLELFKIPHLTPSENTQLSKDSLKSINQTMLSKTYIGICTICKSKDDVRDYWTYINNGQVRMPIKFTYCPECLMSAEYMVNPVEAVFNKSVEPLFDLKAFMEDE